MIILSHAGNLNEELALSKTDEPTTRGLLWSLQDKYFLQQRQLGEYAQNTIGSAEQTGQDLRTAQPSEGLEGQRPLT